MVEREDEELMLEASRGDRDAFAILVERHHRAVVRFVQPFLGVTDREAAEDLAQDVFLAAWKAAPSFRVRAKVLTWLLRITTNVCLNYQRSARLRRTISFLEDHAAGRSDPETENPDADADGDGALSEAEFMAFHAKRADGHRAMVLESHPEADTNGDGVLSETEARAFMGSGHGGGCSAHPDGCPHSKGKMKSRGAQRGHGS